MPAPRICLINMPFASPEAPSLALTQLKAVLDERFGDEVTVEVLYLDLDFLELTGGLSNYSRMTSGHGRLSGAADWFFRQAAFPEAEDNRDAYLERFYFNEDDGEVQAARRFLVEKRPQVEDFLDTLIQRYHLDQATIVGFTALFFQTMASFALARRLKDRNPKLLTVIGGAACETVMGTEFARQVEAIDYVFSGPALLSFPCFVERQLAGDREACERIDGVFSKSNLSAINEAACPGTVKLSEKSIRSSGEERDINLRLPLDYHAFLERFESVLADSELKPMLLFETSRGCSWGEKIACTFCGLNGTAMHYRSMRAENALAQIEALFDYREKCQFFLAVDTIVPSPYLAEVFPKLNTPPQTAFMYEVRPRLSEAELETLCTAGVLVIQPGIEALSTATLKLMRKGTTAFGNLGFLKRCSRFPLRVEWNLLIGSPGESHRTWEKYLADIPLLTHLPPPGGAFPISYDRFSQYFERPEDWELKLQPHEFYRFAYPFGTDSLKNIAYHFVDGATEDANGELDHWLDRLNTAIGEWSMRWDNRDDKEPAQLCVLRDGEALSIYDSRTGVAIDHPITEADAALLEFLETPRRSEQIVAHLGKSAAEHQLQWLRDKGLLLEEQDRLMSLVLL